MAKDRSPSIAKPMFSRRELSALIWPLVIEQFLAIFVGMADIVMVSSLGEACVSGVSLVDSINVLLVQVFAALGTGGAVVVSQFVGRGDGKSASRTARQLIYVTVIIALIMTLLCLALHTVILRTIFGKIDEPVMKASQTYFLITILALPGLALYNSSSAIFRAQGDSRTPMLISLIVNVLNVIGNAIFLYALGSGVEGVALPTLISRTGGAILLIALLHRIRAGHTREGKESVSIRGISHIEFNARIVHKILSIGIPNGMENSTFQVGKILVLSLISTYATAAIAANAAANTLAGFEVLPGQAIGLAMLTVVGQCVGAREYEEAVRYTRLMTRMAYISMIALNVPLLILSHWILGFYHLSPETWQLAWIMTMTHGICGILIWPPSFALPNALRAAGDATFTMIVSIASMWTVRVGLSYVFKWTGFFNILEFFNLPPSFGAESVWIAMVLDWVVRTSFFVHRLNTRRLMHNTSLHI